MYCKNCGSQIDDQASFCSKCGAPVSDNGYSYYQGNANDQSSIWYGLLGFFVPVAGIVLYFVIRRDFPRRCHSMVKGAVIGIVTRVVVTIAAIIFFTAVVGSTMKITTDMQSHFSDEPNSKSTTQILKEDLDVTFGKYVYNNDFPEDSSVETTLKNTSKENYSFDISFEAIKKDGTRITTDTISINTLKPGKTTTIDAFSNVVVPKRQQELKTAKFRVIKVEEFEEK